MFMGENCASIHVNMFHTLCVKDKWPRVVFGTVISVTDMPGMLLCLTKSSFEIITLDQWRYSQLRMMVLLWDQLYLNTTIDFAFSFLILHFVFILFTSHNILSVSKSLSYWILMVIQNNHMLNNILQSCSLAGPAK